MKNLNIKPSKIKLAGSGNPIQWGAVIGIAIDTYVKDASTLDDVRLLDEIKVQLENPGLQIERPSNLDSNNQEAINNLLKEVSSNLTINELEQIFEE